MKQSLLFLAILFTAVSCLKDDSGSNDPRFISVEQYVAFLKSGSFNFWSWEVPVFEISDIPELLKHARSEYEISLDTNPPWSSTYSQMMNTTVGWMVLWIIEGTRLDVDYPSATPAVTDDHSGEIIRQGKVADLYEQWWSRNKDKTAARLKEISPFEGTNLKWL